MTTDRIEHMTFENMLRRAFSLGQIYWQPAPRLKELSRQDIERVFGEMFARTKISSAYVQFARSIVDADRALNKGEAE